LPANLRMTRRAGGDGVILIVFLLACSSRDKPPEVNRVLVEKMEKLEWSSPPGRDGGGALGLVSAAIGDASVEVRKRAAGFLARKRPSGGDSLLLERLAVEQDSLVRRELVSALSGFSTALARGELRRIAAGDEDPGLRALAIGRLGAREGDRDVLRKALSSPDVAERLGAGLALVRHPLQLQAGAVARALEQEQDERVRWVLAEALGLCTRGAEEDLSGEFCSLLLDENFLVSMAAARVLAGLADPECIEAMVELVSPGKKAWAGRLGGALAIEAWLGREEGGFPDASQRARLEAVVLQKAAEVIAGKIPQVALRRAWLRSLLLCRSPAAGEFRRRAREAVRPGLAELLVGVKKRKPEDSLTGPRAALLDALVEKPLERSRPPYDWYSPYGLARVRPPRLILSAGEGRKVTLEMYLSEAPNHVSAVLHLVERGAYAAVELRRLEDPVGVLLDLPVPPGGGAAGCALGRELSQRRILRGTIIVHPLHRGGGRLFIAGRPLPEWEGRVSVLGRIVLGQRTLAGLEDGRKIDLVAP